MGYFISLSKPATKNCLDASEWALLFCGLIVLIGIWGEIKSEQHSKTLRMFEYLVLYGILGELLADGGLFLFSSQLEMISEAEVLHAETSAKQAYVSARDAHRQSTAAQEKASDAIAEAGKLRVRASANEREAARLSREANGQRRIAEQLKVESETLKAKNLETESKLINLAVCNAPRVIPFWSTGGKTSVDSLRPYAGRVAIIEFLPDAEARRAATNIERSLKEAKWDIKAVRVVFHRHRFR